MMRYGFQIFGFHQQQVTLRSAMVRPAELWYVSSTFKQQRKGFDNGHVDCNGDSTRKDMVCQPEIMLVI